jgi:hypothetical protein
MKWLHSLSLFDPPLKEVNPEGLLFTCTISRLLPKTLQGWFWCAMKGDHMGEYVSGIE